jgi:SAM-dependent methyltransferase
VYVNLDKEQLALRISEIAKPKVDFIADVIEWSKDDLWIDIGSGTGDVLVSAKKLGFQVVGLDSSKTETNLALTRNLDARLLYFDENTQFTLFSDAKIVSLFNIVEHTSNPIAFLLNIAQQMKRDSFIIIEVPRANSFTTILQMTLSDNNYRHIFAPEHLNIFSDKSMELLLLHCGFDLSSTWTFGSDAIEIFDFVTRVASPNIEIDYTFFVDLINKLQLNLDDAGLSDVMLIVAKRK